MKNLIFTLFTAFLTVGIASAQNTFTISPNPASVIGYPDTFDTPDHSFIKNISNATQNYRWTRKAIVLPSGFRSAVCDCEQCYIEQVSSMNFTMAPGQQCPLDVHFYNYLQSTGSGIIHVTVTNLAVASDTLTGVYLYNSSSSTDDPLPVAEVHLFPNPTTDGFTLERAEEVAGVRVYALDGRQVAYFEPSDDQRYSLNNQPVGTYIVALVAKNGRVFQALELKKQ